jgi:hypothetical protein
MAFVSETVIDQHIDRLETTSGAYEAALAEMEKEQPVLLAYFFSENFDLFTHDERDYLQYLALVIWSAAREVCGSKPPVNEEQISEAEDINWEKLEAVGSHIFRERVGVFFENYPQEDLLAFVEDALLDDEEDPLVTKEGREALFVTLKSVVDLLTI